MTALARSSFETNAPEEARQAFAPLVPRLEFGRVDPDTFRVWIQARSVSGFSIVDYAFGAPTSVAGGADEVLVVSARGRNVDIRYGRESVDSRRPYINAADGVSGRWDELQARGTVLDRGRLEGVARTISGQPIDRIEPVELAARTPELGRRWDDAVARVRRAMLVAPESFADPVVEEAAFHHLALTYLAAFQLAWPGPDGRHVSIDARSRTVRAAIDHMHAHAASPLTVQQVAAAVHVSPRGLHAAFVSELGRSPSEVLRDIRLTGVRDELRFADPIDGIGAIARRWGFVHLSRFAEAYERAYGELPSATRPTRRRAAA
ncbi:AraC-like DNA-binding protein [Agromyces flavus]|uniref:AraC-like DNA-binding protein n=1 Tax=Agromyces flavus TaxID=589382 RepID=A0A1H1LAT9_9MICO|nr:helix-turn-helix transcriptional regulator [Agromyces flavus]MCP2367491.1 AraC-like DNA-binding protein [Agromyces flavus]GGI45625.1 AraC family transcriptional regulator [Agromyces flavus]SDR71432.1 Helix-turn-helix domain-containing protein [Agromyces flavus]